MILLMIVCIYVYIYIYVGIYIYTVISTLINTHFIWPFLALPPVCIQADSPSELQKKTGKSFQAGEIQIISVGAGTDFRPEGRHCVCCFVLGRAT